MFEIVYYKTVKKKPKSRNGNKCKTAMINIPKKYVGRRVKVIINSISKRNLHYNYG